MSDRAPDDLPSPRVGRDTGGVVRSRGRGVSPKMRAQFASIWRSHRADGRAPAGRPGHRRSRPATATRPPPALQRRRRRTSQRSSRSPPPPAPPDGGSGPKRQVSDQCRRARRMKHRSGMRRRLGWNGVIAELRRRRSRERRTRPKRTSPVSGPRCTGAGHRDRREMQITKQSVNELLRTTEDRGYRTRGWINRIAGPHVASPGGAAPSSERDRCRRSGDRDWRRCSER